MKRGRFIVLEGGEGAGKSTAARHVKDWLQERGRSVVLTREPGGSPLAEAIRETVLRQWPEKMAPETETLLMLAARAAHLAQTVRPALARGDDVVCDRFSDSTYAYQAAGRGVPAAHIEALERWIVADTVPDLVLVLDLDPELGLARARGRGEQNRFEQEEAAFRQRVRDAFLQRARTSPARYAVIDAAAPLEQVLQAIAAALEQRL